MADKLPLSRRDFLKLTGIGLGAAGLVAAGIEVNTNPHLVNGLKVTRELIAAEVSGDPEKILESRKLAMVWLFAETAAKYAKEMGMEKAGSNMEHYMYGNGQPVDISPLLEKVVRSEPESFVGDLISAAIRNKEENNNYNVSPKKDYQFTNRALKELKSEAGLNASLDAREWIGMQQGWDELYNAFGGAKYLLHAPEADIVSQEGYAEYVVLEKGIDIVAKDRYYWQLNHPVSLPSDLGRVVGEGSDTLFDQFYKSHDVVEKTIRGLNLPEDSVTRIMNIYSDDQKDEIRSNLASNVHESAEKTIQSLIGRPDLVENDLNLLKKLGAMEYDMTGHVNIPSRLEVVV